MPCAVCTTSLHDPAKDTCHFWGGRNCSSAFIVSYRMFAFLFAFCFSCRSVDDDMFTALFFIHRQCAPSESDTRKSKGRTVRWLRLPKKGIEPFHLREQECILTEVHFRTLMVYTACVPIKVIMCNCNVEPLNFSFVDIIFF